MCRMLAVIGDAALQTKALRAFHRLAECGNVRCGMTPGHMDGWGIAAYGEHGAAYVARSAGSAVAETAAYQEAVTDVVEWRSPIVIAHFRKASQGGARLENTHPFLDPPWIFCHNGTVYDLDRFGPRPPVVGQSDTEELLVRWRCAVSALPQSPASGVMHFQEWVRDVERHCRFTSLTTLLTNGRELLARRRIGPPKPDALDDPKPYYTLYHWQQGKTHLLCSEPLPELDGTWRLLDDGESVLLSFSDVPETGDWRPATPL